MIKLTQIALIGGIFAGITACSPVTLPVTNHYQLDSFDSTARQTTTWHRSLLITPPDALAGYQSDQMLYQSKPYELSAFAHNAWMSAPASMLYPLMFQSLEHSHAFFAVTTSPEADTTDYRLDTQLIKLKQNFVQKPSVLEWAVHAVLTHVNDRRVIASQTFHERITCAADTPYGGVIAANQAARVFTHTLTKFVIVNVQADQKTNHKRYE